MKRFRRELTIDMVIHRYHKKIGSSLVLPSYLKQVGLAMCTAHGMNHADLVWITLK